MSSQPKATNERQRMIAEAAYFKAERRGFSGDATRDWCEAEIEVDARLRRQECEQLVAKLEAVASEAAKKAAAAGREAAKLSARARAAWEKDVERLATLREALQPALTELKEQGERAGHTLREQADKIRADIVDLVRRLETKARH